MELSVPVCEESNRSGGRHMPSHFQRLTGLRALGNSCTVCPEEILSHMGQLVCAVS